MGFRIPAGALTISIGADGNAEMNVTKVEVSLDFWDHWLELRGSTQSKQSPFTAR